MHLYLDSANLEEVEECLKRGLIDGITTNPTIIAKSGTRGWRSHIYHIGDLIQKYNPNLHLSVELTTANTDEMLDNALSLVQAFGYLPNLVIKVPVGWDELEVMYCLHEREIRVNATACMSFNQCVVAALAGADYVSLFWGRIRDTGYDAGTIVKETKSTFTDRQINSQIIVGSIRQMIDINEALTSGADIVTAPYALLNQLCRHPKTDEVVAQFMKDARTLV